MNKRQRKKRDKRRSVGWAMAAQAGADFIRSELSRSSRHPGLAVQACVPVGRWRDALDVVHEVNAFRLVSDGVIDLGRQTSCGAHGWDPDNPELYPDGRVADLVDCLACLARGGSS